MIQWIALLQLAISLASTRHIDCLTGENRTVRLTLFYKETLRELLGEILALNGLLEQRLCLSWRLLGARELSCVLRMARFRQLLWALT